MYKIIQPLLFCCDPEKVHENILYLGTWLQWVKKPISFFYRYEHPSLETTIAGISFKNPIGLAAGFDKNGILVDFLPALGFGFLEIGSITALPSEGNPKPRLFRLPKDEALINRMGLNNIGAENVVERLQGKKHDIPIGINIAKTNDPIIMGEKAIDDFCTSYKKLHDIADYMVLNISCPNTHEGKTFEEEESLEHLLYEMTRLRRGKPLFLKLSPDLSYDKIDIILEIGIHYFIDGYVIGNTTTRREHLRTSPENLVTIGRGGLSGKPISKKSTEIIRYIYKQWQPVIIGVGGIFSGEDAYEKITAGASLVQIYTGLIYEGPGLIKKIKMGLVRKLEHDGFSSLRDAVGSRAFDRSV